ncbi:MAG TPA: YdeI/OmpD-associated family protein [Mycobacteriales bacterium]|nr:YdeI/OmpD-associated family protein [Mycobacteriales bacterium]
MTDAPELLVADVAEWHEWLAAHLATSTGVRLVLAKKGATEPTRLTYDEALPEALCYGWIDGQLTRRDDTTYRVRFTPRRARSAWSARNVAAAEQLISQGRMQPPGLAEVELAKNDGRWAKAYDGSASIAVPNDLREALAASPRALAMWDVLTRTNRYSVLYRVQEAKRADTRARRISQYVDMLARGDTPHPQKAKPADVSSDERKTTPESADTDRLRRLGES